MLYRPWRHLTRLSLQKVYRQSSVLLHCCYFRHRSIRSFTLDRHFHLHLGYYRHAPCAALFFPCSLSYRLLSFSTRIRPARAHPDHHLSRSHRHHPCPYHGMFFQRCVLPPAWLTPSVFLFSGFLICARSNYLNQSRRPYLSLHLIH